MGRQAVVKLAFEVDEAGHPTLMRVQEASKPIWGGEAHSVAIGNFARQKEWNTGPRPLFHRTCLGRETVYATLAAGCSSDVWRVG